MPQEFFQQTFMDRPLPCEPTVAIKRLASLCEVTNHGVDPAPLWQTYVEAGWTELTDPENAVELAVLLEELGRATDPTPYLATLTQFAPLAGDRFDPRQSGTAIYGGVTARRDGEGWVLDGTKTSVTKTNLYRVGVDMPAVNVRTETPQGYCRGLVTAGHMSVGA